MSLLLQELLQMIDILWLKLIKSNIDSLTYLTSKKKKHWNSNCLVNLALAKEARSIDSDWIGQYSRGDRLKWRVADGGKIELHLKCDTWFAQTRAPPIKGSQVTPCYSIPPDICPQFNSLNCILSINLLTAFTSATQTHQPPTQIPYSALFVEVIKAWGQNMIRSWHGLSDDEYIIKSFCFFKECIRCKKRNKTQVSLK